MNCRIICRIRCVMLSRRIDNRCYSLRMSVTDRLLLVICTRSAWRSANRSCWGARGLFFVLAVLVVCRVAHRANSSGAGGRLVSLWLHAGHRTPLLDLSHELLVFVQEPHERLLPRARLSHRLLERVLWVTALQHALRYALVAHALYCWQTPKQISRRELQSLKFLIEIILWVRVRVAK